MFGLGWSGMVWARLNEFFPILGLLILGPWAIKILLLDCENFWVDGIIVCDFLF